MADMVLQTVGPDSLVGPRVRRRLDHSEWHVGPPAPRVRALGAWAGLSAGYVHGPRGMDERRESGETRCRQHRDVENDAGTAFGPAPQRSIPPVPRHGSGGPPAARA